MRPKKENSIVVPHILATFLLTCVGCTAFAQVDQVRSIGGKEHEDNILGVRIGMSVSEALEAVFVGARRLQGQEKPDAMRHEGKDNKDVRVVYNNLKVGKLQIMFAQGKWVKEINLEYAERPLSDDLRLAPSGSINNVMGGQRYDDRYTIGYTEEAEAKRQRIWYRDQRDASGFRERIQFLSGRNPDTDRIEGKQVVRKLIFITPGDEEKFLKAMAGQENP